MCTSTKTLGYLVIFTIFTENHHGSYTHMYMMMYVIRENGYRIIIILLYIQRLNGGFVERPYIFAAHHTVYNIPTHRYLYIY